VLPFFTPTPPPYDALAWEKLPFAERSRMVCEAWAVQGYGSPPGALVFHALKVAVYIAGWVLFCSTSPGMDSIANIATWSMTSTAFIKALLWSMLFEGMGFGCGSGPLTGRYLPPIVAFTHFLRPGTTKLPLIKALPHRRSMIDVALYFALIVLLVRALVAPAPGQSELVPIVVLIPLLGVLDKTIFLILRSEHLWTMLVCAVLADNIVPGAKAVQLALWFWAGVSKLNHHFPSVVGVMISNHPLFRWRGIRTRMYRDFPRDLRPSLLATIMAHIGTSLEFITPILFFLGDGGVITFAGIIAMLLLHVFITASVPMGVPIEWNFLMVYGGFFLFVQNASVSLADVSPALLPLLLVFLVVIPLVGNLFPHRVSFLLAMRYYAGNWPFSIWLFRGDTHKKLDKLTKTSAWPLDQLNRLYDNATSVGVLGKVIAFRAMHLQGRLLHDALPKAVDDLEAYQYVDGELIAGLALGWNFGDGHLHQEQLLRSIVAQCGYEAGELRCIFIEPQALFGNTMSYRVVDAVTGEITRGVVEIAKLRERQPFP
jgi:hypothetical protein